MFSVSKIKLYVLVWLACIVIIMANTSLTTAQDAGKAPKNSSSAPSGSCVPCNDVQVTCPSCPDGTKCILTLRSCSECPKPRCVKPSPDESGDDGKNDKGNKVLLPAVIGGILGVGFLTAIGYGSFAWRRKMQNKRGVKLDGNDEMTSSTNIENVIPIAYIPPSTPDTPRPEATYPRLQISNISGGTTPLASPLPYNLGEPYNLGDEQLVDVTDDDDTASVVGTILQATKTATTSTATLMTATRAKPALVRLNTIKSTTDTNSAKSIRSDNSIPSTPKTPMTGNTFLGAPSISSVPSSPTSNFSIRVGGDSDTEQMMPRIDIERPSAESARVTNHSTSQNLNSPLLDPIEGRQSFGLFGSDEVYSNDPSSPQLQRESIMSSSSSNGRSTMSSVDGDGEITIFWGGNTPPFVTSTGGGGHNQIKESENHVDSTNNDQNKEIKAKESI